MDREEKNLQIQQSLFKKTYTRNIFINKNYIFKKIFSPYSEVENVEILDVF